MRTVMILTAAVAVLYAQEPAKLELSLKQAVEIALAPNGNARVQLAEELIRQSEAQAAEVRSALLPDLDSSVSDRSQTLNLRTFGLQFPALGGFTFPSVVGPFGVFDARATLTQTVFDFSAIRRYQASRVSVDAQKAEGRSTRDQVAGRVARAYLAGLRAEAALETGKANVELSQALRKLAASQKTAGTGTGIEITRADVQLSNDRQRFLVAENERDRSHLELLKELGLKLDGVVALTGRLSYQPADTTEVARATEMARENRADLAAQQKRAASASLSYRAVKMERLPSLSAFADYGTIGSGISDSLTTRTYGMSLKIPLFDGGRRDARRAESLSLAHQEKIRTADLRDQVELEVRLALNSLRSAEEQVKVAREGLELAENEVAQARRRYEAGVSTNLEVTDAQTRIARARDNNIAALYNYNLARIDLGTATGTIQKMVEQ